ncbi:MAG: proton-conducting transporter membrane subunit [Thermoprotei archaeon]
MIMWYILVLTLVLGSLPFFVKSKKASMTLAALSIVPGFAYFAFYNRLEAFYVAPTVGSFGLVVNNLSLPMIVTILPVTLLTVFYSARYMEERFHELGQGSWGTYFGLYSLFALSMLYTVMSTNLLEIYLFLELGLVTSFLLILLYGYGDRKRISLLYFVWTHVATILMLISVVLLGIETGTMDIYKDATTLYNYSQIAYAGLILLAGFVGMMIKGAMGGVNVWLPYAHGEAPTPISVLLSPNMVGLGVYTATIYMYLFRDMTWLGPVFVTWAVFTMIYGGLNALAQIDFKRFLAYSSVSQMGYMLLGSSIAFYVGLKGSVAELPLGVIASLLVYVSHGFGKAILFMSAGAMITELHERDIYKLGGLYSSSPLHSTLAFIGALNLLGLPPTVGLISEVLLLLSIGDLLNVMGVYAYVILIAFLMIAIGVSSAYLTYLYKRVFAGKPKESSLDRAKEYNVPMALLAAVSIALFFVPQLVVPPLSNFYAPIGGSDYYLAAIVFLPLLGALIALITPKGLNQDARGSIVVALIGVSAILATLELVKAIPQFSLEAPLKQIDSYDLGGFFTFRLSPLQAILGALVSWLSFFISLYSVGYMKEDNVLRRYWGFFGFFVSSMLAVVYADNMLLFLTGWEGTSLASYGLISYWLDDNDRNIIGDLGRYVLGIEYISRPTTSGIRAMIFTRLGDVGLISSFGYLLFLTSGSQYLGNTSLYGALLPHVGELYQIQGAWIVLLFLMLGGLGKSAQFPLTQWLLTAMTGPTPVSALIHAATMVNLGAILTYFVYPYLKYPDPQTLLFASVMFGISLFTAVYTSTSALASNEQKLILAYSTADQISLMILTSSAGAVVAAATGDVNFLYVSILVSLFQMMAHGVYKATLFMNAGTLIHYTESRYVGITPRLYKHLKLVFVLQLIAALNLANLIPLIGFWAHNAISAVLANYGPVWGVYVLTEFLGAIYITRYIAKTFLWPKGEELHEEGHYSPIMFVSPLILAIVSIALGLAFPTIASYFLGQEASHVLEIDVPELALSLIGIAIAFALFVRGFEMRPNPLVNFLYYAWYVNPAFDKFGFKSFDFAKGLYKHFEFGVIDTYLNVKLPNGLISAGNSLVRGLQDQVLRDYIGVYVSGLLLVIVILLLVLAVV